MVTTVYLVRHGETEGQDRQCYHGSTDVGLSARGSAQIKSAAAFIAGHLMASNPEGDHTLAAVYCSRLQRSIASAALIADQQGLKHREIEDLGERRFGCWEGLTFSGIEKNHPEGFAAWLANPLTYRPEGGENALQVRERTVRVMEQIVARHQGSSFAVVAHGGVNRIILCHLLGMPLANLLRIEQDYGAVNIIEFWDAYPVVKLMNGPPRADRAATQGQGQQEVSGRCEQRAGGTEMQGYVQVYTGDGKGKTTAALGLALRSAGAGLKVFIAQFVKGAEYSEIKALGRFSDLIVLKQYGRGCFISQNPGEEDKRLAGAGLAEAEAAMLSGAYQVIILDEVNIATYFDLFPVSRLLEMIRQKPAGVELVLTGRKADPRVVEIADLVTEMGEIKHYYQKGVEARAGIEK